MTQPALADALLAWYDRHGRKNLPWQQDPTPYRVWISEVMLQQTRVATVIPYYLRFMARFPTLGDLAKAPQDVVLQHWSGLGYYARARNLHRTARIVADEHGGALPTRLETLCALPGIGRSTGGAILALSGGQRHAILDGNARRVLARFHAVGGWPGTAAVQQRLWALAEAHLPAHRLAAYTQAIMDLGAMVCTRTRPACESCPLRANCQGAATGRPTAFPGRRPTRARKIRDITVLILQDPGGAIYLRRRPPRGIWGGLWSLPELPAGVPPREAASWCWDHLGLAVGQFRHGEVLEHDLTHLRLRLHPWLAPARPLTSMEPDAAVWYNEGLSEAHGIPTAIRRLLDPASMQRRSSAISTRSDR